VVVGRECLAVGLDAQVDARVVVKAVPADVQPVGGLGREVARALGPFVQIADVAEMVEDLLRRTVDVVLDGAEAPVDLVVGVDGVRPLDSADSTTLGRTTALGIHGRGSSRL
jgi:hypothetical protein